MNYNQANRVKKILNDMQQIFYDLICREIDTYEKKGNGYSFEKKELRRIRDDLGMAIEIVNSIQEVNDTNEAYYKEIEKSYWIMLYDFDSVARDFCRKKKNVKDLDWINVYLENRVDVRDESKKRKELENFYGTYLSFVFKDIQCGKQIDCARRIPGMEYMYSSVLLRVISALNDKYNKQKEQNAYISYEDIYNTALYKLYLDLSKKLNITVECEVSTIERALLQPEMIQLLDKVVLLNKFLTNNEIKEKIKSLSMYKGNKDVLQLFYFVLNNKEDISPLDCIDFMVEKVSTYEQLCICAVMYSLVDCNVTSKTDVELFFQNNIFNILSRIMIGSFLVERCAEKKPNDLPDGIEVGNWNVKNTKPLRPYEYYFVLKKLEKIGELKSNVNKLYWYNQFAKYSGYTVVDVLFRHLTELGIPKDGYKDYSNSINLLIAQCCRINQVCGVFSGEFLEWIFTFFENEGKIKNNYKKEIIKSDKMNEVIGRWCSFITDILDKYIEVIKCCKLRYTTFYHMKKMRKKDGFGDMEWYAFRECFDKPLINNHFRSVWGEENNQEDIYAVMVKDFEREAKETKTPKDIRTKDRKNYARFQKEMFFQINKEPETE